MRRILRNEQESEIKKTVGSKKADEAVVLPATLIPRLSKITKKLSATKTVRSKKAAPEEVQMPTVLRSEAAKAKSGVEEQPKKEVVFVSASASLRLLEKAELYRLWYRENFPTYMAAAAKVGGYAFILSGTLFASFGYLADKDLFGPAAAICTSVDCTEEVVVDALPQSTPLVTFLNMLPSELITETDINLRVENTSELKVLLSNIESGERITLLPVEGKEGGEYKYLLQPDIIPGTYTLQVEAHQGAAIYKFSGQTFTVPSRVVVPEELPPASEDESTTTPSATEVETETDETYTVINGTTIPNSYVTIISNSFGTVGLIRTDTEGEFSYTLERELVEGGYEFATVFTDTDGSILDSSQPFLFTEAKRSQLAAVTSAQQTTHDTLPTVVMASVAVAAFGFLLLLLAQTLQKRRHELVESTVPKTIGA